MIHSRQFLIGPRPAAIGLDWVVEQVGPDRYFSYDPSLPVERVATSDGVVCRLLGTAIASDPGPDTGTPGQAIARHAAASLPALTRSWSGRWALLVDGRLHLDACGLLGVYYSPVRADSADDQWLSSSPSLIQALTGARPFGSPRSWIAPGRRLDWYPPPLSRSPGIRRLLPSQTIDVVTQELAHAALGVRAPVPSPSPSPDPRAIAARLVRIMRGLGDHGLPIWIPLTGGMDSRLILAAACAAGIDPSTYTYEKPPSVMAYADRDLPRKIAARVGVEHTLVPRSEFDADRLAAFDEHSKRNTMEVDRLYYAFRQWGALPQPALILRGGVFEAGRCYYWRKLAPLEIGDPGRITREIWTAFGIAHHPGSEVQRQGIASWVQWITDLGEDIDWRDRFYVEQRVGGWLSALEQGLDITGYDRLHVGNCADLISEFLAFPPDVRASATHQLEVIELLAPELARFPVNPPATFAFRVRNEARLLSESRGKRAYLRARVARLRAKLRG